MKLLALATVPYLLALSPLHAMAGNATHAHTIGRCHIEANCVGQGTPVKTMLTQVTNLPPYCKSFVAFSPLGSLCNRVDCDGCSAMDPGKCFIDGDYAQWCP